MTRDTAGTPPVRRPAPPGTLHHRLARPASARLCLDSKLGRRGAVDGGWWPRSRDAGAELSALVTALDGRLGTITSRISVHVDGWDDIPRRLLVGDHVVRVSWFRSMDAHGLTATTSQGDSLELLVIPAATAPTPAGIAMAMAMVASGKADRRRPTDMLAAGIDAARARAPQWADREQEHAWENEGGRTRVTAKQGSRTTSAV